MGNKKDIGKFFESRLIAGNKVPKERLWEKINTSLDKEKRKRKRILFYWWLGGGISVLFGLYLLFGTGNFLNQKSQTPSENNTSEENSFSTSEKEEIENLIPISEERLSKIEVANEDETIKNKENTSKTASEKKTQKGASKRKSIDEIYTVSKKYYYYNSKDGKQIITTNKSEIDSLISHQYKSLDSTATKNLNNSEE